MSDVCIYDSGLLDFAEDENSCVEIDHNLGICPRVIQITGESEGLGLPAITDVNGDLIDGVHFTQEKDLNTLKVWKLDNYSYTGKFRVRIF